MENKITLELTMEQANLVLRALGELPFRDVYQLVDIIQTQASEQLNPQAIGEKDDAMQDPE